ncbi:HEXXH motif domain-containing protein [Amycolatopsis sp. OK19-0408]|uniref:HEXXH motif domain-containing protein n=1 Tax=Amycolatopsis iheyensis TaxID=2945988 RepID=A0A9X2N3N5_9PSEU|nr:HEXXH motif domain-containing protein [Amycolatopsis iheyensis]MCR6481681.1 HEXXH motif domain-containing protein [Amycolatopsis iheyensis]
MSPSRSTPAELTVHTLSWPDFDSLAQGASGADGVRALRAAERSRRLLLLRGLVDDSLDPRLHAPLASPDGAWDLLARAEEAAPEAVETVIAHPYTGSWAGYTTRLIHQGLTGTCPLWMHVGHLHALAAAAAVRAGLEFHARVPMWKGHVSLPSLGSAHFPGAPEFDSAEIRGHSGTAEIRWHDAVVRIPFPSREETAGWSPLRTWDFEADGKRLTLTIDDLDPYRGLFTPLTPDRLGDEDLTIWHGKLTEAWRLIATHTPEFADALSAGLDTIVPEPPFPFRLPSASTGEAFGSAIICRPEDAVTLAAALVHEFQHIRLGGLLQLVRLHDDDRTERLYAPWRDDPRPLGGVVHGVYAFFGVSVFYRAYCAANPDDEASAFEYAHWRGQVWRTLETIREDAALTDAGRRFLDRIAAEMREWHDEPVPAAARRRADTLAADHYAGWRSRHLRPAEETVTTLLRAWRSGTPCPPVSPTGHETLDTKPDGDWSDARSDLMRVRLGKDGEAAVRKAWPRIEGGLEPDAAFINDDAESAVSGYRAELSHDPDSPSALVGLGLALRDVDPLAAEALVTVPELVRTVHRAARTSATAVPSVEELARWLRSGVTTIPPK